MMRSILPPAVLLLVISAAGCGKSESSESSAPSGSTASSTQPATTTASASETGSLGIPPNAPKVGIRPGTFADYKPVVGKYGGRIVRDTLSEPKSFNSITVGETSTSEYTGRMFEGLTKTNVFTGEAGSYIAEKWEHSDDGLTWTFHLRKDVTFNDGSPLTAQDVVFTLNDLIYDNNRPAGKDPRWPCSARDALTFEDKQLKISAPDDYTVQIVTPVKIAIMDQMAGFAILSKKKYEPLARAGTFGGAMSTDSKPQDIVGSGPFMFGSYTRGESVILKRNPNYWRKDTAGNKLPYLDDLYFHIVRDMNIMLLDFEQGITDAYMVRSGKEVARLRPNQDSQKFSLYQFGPDDGDLFVALNMNLDAAKAGKVAEYKVNWFRDRRFRQALSYAIDRDAQVKNIRQNLGYPEGAPQTLAPGPFRQDGFPPPPHDPEKAKALLDEMGLKMGADGVRHDAQGHEVSFTLNTNSGNNMREEACNFIRKDLENIGVKVNILFLEFNLLIDKMDVTYDWDALVMGLTGGSEPHWGSNIWKSSGRLHMWWPNQKTPRFAWEKEIDDLFNAGIQELDHAKRKEIYRKWVEIAWREQPFVYLTVAERVAALRRRFGNIFPGYVGDTPVDCLLNNEEEIFVLQPK